MLINTPLNGLFSLLVQQTENHVKYSAPQEESREMSEGTVTKFSQ